MKKLLSVFVVVLILFLFAAPVLAQGESSNIGVKFERTNESPVDVTFRVTITNLTPNPEKQLTMTALLEDLSIALPKLNYVKVEQISKSEYLKPIYGELELTPDVDETGEPIYKSVIIGYETKYKETREDYKDWFFRGKTPKMDATVNLPSSEEDEYGFGEGTIVLDFTINTGLQVREGGKWGSKGLLILDINGKRYFDSENSSWWDNNWLYRNILSFNASVLTENLTNFPLTVFLNATNKFDFAKILAGGADIRFVDKDDTTSLPYHITQWDDVSENATVVVQVPQIDLGSDYSDYIYIYYGNAGAGDNQNKNAVWASTNATAVWPLYTVENNGNLVYDSTSNNNTGTAYGGASFVSKGTASESTEFEITPAYPASVAANDIVFLQVISNQPNGIGTIATPVGFTLADNTTYQNSVPTVVGTAALFWKRAIGGESGTISVTRTGDNGTDTEFFGQTYLVRGAITTGNPYEDMATRDGIGNTTNTWDAVTVNGIDRLLLALIAEADDPVPGVPTGYSSYTGDLTTVGTDAYLDISRLIGQSSDGLVTSATGQTEGWVSFHLSISPEYSFWTPNGRSFDGTDDRVSCGDAASLDFTTEDFAVGIWFKANTLSGYQDFVSRADVNDFGWEIEFRDTGNLWFKTYTAGAFQSTRAGINTFATDIWYHLVIVRQGANVKIYKNGVDLNVATGTHPDPLLSAAAINLRIGTQSASQLYDMNGTIGEVRIYNRALSAEEIKYTKLSEQYFYTGVDGGFIYYGNEDPPPTLSTLAASGISMDRDGVTVATVSGNLTSLGGTPSVDFWWEYGLTIAYGSVTANTSTSAIGIKTALLPNNLTPGATYHDRFVGQNVDGTTYGADDNFILTIPTILTVAASNFAVDKDGVTSFRANGEVTSMGVASSVYVDIEYGETIGYGHDTANQTLAGIGTYFDTIAGDYNTQVHYRARVIVGNVVVNSSDELVNSSNYTLPTLSVLPVGSSYIDGTGSHALARANVDAMGDASDLYGYFEWGYDASFGHSTATQVVAATGEFSSDIQHYDPSRTVYYRGVGIAGGTVYTTATSFLIAESGIVTGYNMLNSVVVLAYTAMVIFAILVIGQKSAVGAVVFMAVAIYIGEAFIAAIQEAILNLF